MLLGSFVAAFFAFKSNFLAGWTEVLQEMLAEEVWVFLVCLLFGALIAQLTVRSAIAAYIKAIPFPAPL